MLVADFSLAWTLTLIAIAAVAILFACVVIAMLSVDMPAKRRRVATEIREASQQLLDWPENPRGLSRYRLALNSDYVFERFYATYEFGKVYKTLRKHARLTEELEPLLHTFTSGLLHQDEFIRNAAAQSLADLGSDATFATDTLATTLKEYPYEGAGMYSAVALRNIGQPTDTVTEALWSLRGQTNMLAFDEASKTYFALTGRELPTDAPKTNRSERRSDDDTSTGNFAPAPA